VAWSPQAERSWDDFCARVAAEGERWDAAGVAYHRSPQVAWR
jgi:hexosaminidase